jgi:sarcosine oxidase subunit gamma
LDDAPGSIDPKAQLRRSFVWRKLAERGARFAAVNGGAIAADYGDGAAEGERARRMGIADLSPLPRAGFKGKGAAEWLQFHGVEIGSDSNRAYRQSGGEMALRLAPTEVLLLDSLAGAGGLMDRLNNAWRWGEEKPRRPIGYPVPRADSHCWFALTGACCSEMFSKICGVDLRLGSFIGGSIAQTSIAKMSGIILRHDFGEVPGFHLLADSASADYLWDCLQDAMDEFDGGPVGLDALRRLA